VLGRRCENAKLYVRGTYRAKLEVVEGDDATDVELFEIASDSFGLFGDGISGNGE